MSFRTGRFSRIAILGMVAAATTTTALADEPGGNSMRSRARSGEIKGVEEISEELVIIGKIQKPEVFYVLGRSEFAYRGIKLKRSFVDEIRRSVRDNPF